MDHTNVYRAGNSSKLEGPPKRKAKEPDEYVNLVKECNLCGNSNVIFKYLNNKKRNQPRYQCLHCYDSKSHPHLFNPFPIREHVHENGYTKLKKEEPKALKGLVKVCDKCGSMDAKFRGFNNGKETQPRYVCKACKHLFSPLKNKKTRRVVENEAPNEFSSQYENESQSRVGLESQPQTSETTFKYGFQYSFQYSLQPQAPLEYSFQQPPTYRGNVPLIRNHGYPLIHDHGCPLQYPFRPKS